jgi:hypothetical protein
VKALLAVESGAPAQLLTALTIAMPCCNDDIDRPAALVVAKYINVAD